MVSFSNATLINTLSTKPATKAQPSNRHEVGRILGCLENLTWQCCHELGDDVLPVRFLVGIYLVSQILY